MSLLRGDSSRVISPILGRTKQSPKTADKVPWGYSKRHGCSAPSEALEDCGRAFFNLGMKKLTGVASEHDRSMLLSHSAYARNGRCGDWYTAETLPNPGCSWVCTIRPCIDWSRADHGRMEYGTPSCTLMNPEPYQRGGPQLSRPPTISARAVFVGGVVPVPGSLHRRRFQNWPSGKRRPEISPGSQVTTTSGGPPGKRKLVRGAHCPARISKKGYKDATFKRWLNTDSNNLY